MIGGIQLNKIKLLFLLIFVIVLSGCMYPENEKAETMIPYEEHLNSVQNAVNQFRESSGGLLPIQTRDMDTDQYIKYPIDFSKIVPAYLDKIPGNAFEKGGIYQYVLMDVEENPTVKLVDLRSAEKIRELNIRKGINGILPASEAITKDVFKLNYDLMGYKTDQSVPSPYSDVSLPLVMTGDGTVYVDYSIDINRVLKESNVEVKPGDDLRELLVEKYPIVPAYSLPYTIDENNEPTFMLEKSK